MEFFNKKEDVIDLQLTQYGRFLLSKGKFKPVYYSFYDDNILYNSSRAGFEEKQNNSETRIRDMQTMKPQISVSSAEKSFKENYELILAGKKDKLAVDMQRTPEKAYLLPQPIGTSDVNSEYAPSWTIQFLNGGLSGSSESLDLTGVDGGLTTLSIPQLECEVKIGYEDIDSSDASGTPETDETEDGPGMSSLSITSNEDDMFVLLKLQESNAPFQKKNFDIEMFEILEEYKGTKTVETLRPLSFSKRSHPETEVAFLDETYPDENKNNVEYYFDILIDNEISDELICQLDPTDEKLGVYADERTAFCQDVINKQKRKVFDIYEDESDYPGDVC